MGKPPIRRKNLFIVLTAADRAALVKIARTERLTLSDSVRRMIRARYHQLTTDAEARARAAG